MGEPLDPPGLNAWSPLHPNELFQRLRGVEAPWHMAGGWALDLWHGFETRRHEDIEIAIIRSDFAAIRQALADMQFFCADGGQVRYLPADEEPPGAIHQVWCLDAKTRRWTLDIMLEPGTVDEWVFRRDKSICRLRSDMVGRTSDGLPFLKPAGVLLFKAKDLRGKDETDFENAVGKLDAEERAWLKAALGHAHRGHDWISLL
jgi:hypothetical protein